jgi:hypothetical protein
MRYGSLFAIYRRVSGRKCNVSSRDVSGRAVSYDSTMLCWGSWANTLKLFPGYRFQLFYWDFRTSGCDYE